jgi:Peptidase propeptide and YPEB domain
MRLRSCVAIFWRGSRLPSIALHPSLGAIPARSYNSSLSNRWTGVSESVQGTVVGVELEREKGRWVYEAKVIAPDGRLIEMYIDARTGAIISQRARRNASWE